MGSGGAEKTRPRALPRLCGRRSSQHVHGSNPTAVTSRKTGLARPSKGVHEADPEVMPAVTEIDFTGWAIILMLGGSAISPSS
jgi:hypothetical protein